MDLAPSDHLQNDPFDSDNFMPGISPKHFIEFSCPSWTQSRTKRRAAKFHADWWHRDLEISVLETVLADSTFPIKMVTEINGRFGPILKMVPAGPPNSNNFQSTQINRPENG